MTPTPPTPNGPGYRPGTFGGVPEAAAHSPARTKQHLRVRRVAPLTAGAVAVSFDEPDGDAFDYHPGQYLTLTIPLSGGDVERCYSLCSAPHGGEPMTIGVKRVEGGQASHWICDQLRPGMTLESLPPSGTFVPHSLTDNFVLVAAGSGITPLLSIAKSAVAQPSTNEVALVYANQSQSSKMFSGEIDELLVAHPSRFHLTDWFDDSDGVPTATVIADVLADRADSEIFVCGPPPFLDVVRGAVDLLDIPWTRVKRERFSFDPPPARCASDAEKGTATIPTNEGPAVAHLDIRGHKASVQWPRGTVLLDQLIARGFDIPYVCRSGYCGGCVCTVSDGEVEMLVNDALDETDIAEGRRLACQSIPVTAEVSAAFLD